MTWQTRVRHLRSLPRPPSVRITRFGLGAGVALALLLLSPTAADAHALVVSSDPPAGASLIRVPGVVTVTFSEAPEPNHSYIRVFNSSNDLVSRGAARSVPSNRLQLAVQLEPLLNGVYTVRWYTVSADDGHASSGSYTFGVGPSAYAFSGGPAPSLAAPPTSSSPVVVGGHWVFYVGLGLLVGGAWVSLFALRAVSRRLLLLTLFGAFIMLLGLVVYGVAQAEADGTPIADLPGTSLGLGLVGQALPGLLAAGCVEVALWRGGRVRQRALVAATALAGITIAVHVLTTHASASRLAWLMVAVQWAHLASFAAWTGGLAGLLVAIGSSPSVDKAAAVRRFSQVAAVALGVVGVTGLLRAVDEVAAWAALVGTLFGQLVLVKAGLLLVMASLGAVNRFRSVPAAERTLDPVRRVGRAEVGVAAVVLVASSLLTSLVPPAFVRAAVKQPPPPKLVARGAAVGVRATLEVSPGYPGQNGFRLREYDSRTGKTLVGDVTLHFLMPARPELPESTLALQRTTDGSYAAVGSNISLIGDWSITAVMQRGTEAVDVPFRVTSRPSPEQLHGMTMGNLPMVHGLRLANGWQLQAYLTPGRPGRNALHLIFTDQRSGPVLVPTIPAVTANQRRSARSLTLIRLITQRPTPNHFYAAGTFSAGTWNFQVVAVTGDGTQLDPKFSLTIKR